MKPFSTIWKTLIASMFVASAVLLTGCNSQTDADGQRASEMENSTGEPADVKIDVPGLDLEIKEGNGSAKVDIDVPEDDKSKEVEIDVNSPE